MNRLISILITLFVIFLIYIWINSVMSKKSAEPEMQASVNNERVDSNSGEEAEESFRLSNYDEKKGTDKSDGNEDAGTGAQDRDAPPVRIPATQETETGQQTPKPAAPKPAPPKKVANAANMHLVIAGNFMKRENAETRLNELLNNGYPDSEIVIFDLSEYFTVIAGRFSDIIEARRIAKKVNDYLNIEAYVRVGKN